MSSPINNTKNNIKNNNNRNVNPKNYQIRSDIINKIRNIAHNGIEIDRHSLTTILENHFNSFKHPEKLFLPPVETIKNSHAMRTNDRNDEKLSHTECCNMLRNGRAEWSSYNLPQTYKNSDSMSNPCTFSMILSNQIP
jgi:hypothetical protein